MTAESELLARLVTQASEGGALVTARAMVEEASEAGARRALARIGLGDVGAGDDVRELRQLLQAWRDAKRSARGAVIGWVVRAGCALLLLGLAVKLGLSAGLKG